MFPCHSQKNYYRVRAKTWAALGRTTGEQTCGSWRLSHEQPPGTRLNGLRLQWPDALYVAKQQPGGAVIHKLSGGVFDVYSASRIARFKEILSHIRSNHVKG